MAARTSPRKPRRRWWQLACRAAALVVLALAGAYASLPWWAPTGYLCRLIAADLAGQMGVGVRIDSMALSWADGVEIRELAVDSPGAIGTAPMLHVAAIRTELSPVNYVLHKRIAWMEIVEPTLRVRLDANGQANLQPLSRLKADVGVDRVSVQDGRATLELAGERRAVSLRVPSLQFEPARIRQVTMSAALEQSGGAGDAPVSLSPAAGEAGVAAAAAFTFANVRLEQLPLRGALSLPVKKLSGTCEGSLNLKVDREGVVEGFHFATRVLRLDVQPVAGPELPVIDEAYLRVSAAYDHLTGALQVHAASIRLPGVELTGKAKVFTQALAGHAEAVELLDFAGRIDPARLTALLTGRPALPGDLAVSGPVGVTLDARREAHRLRLDVSADATAAAVRRGKDVLKPAGRTCRMAMQGTLDERTGQLAAEQTSLALSSNRFRGHGTLRDVRRLVRRLAAAKPRDVARTVLGELAGLRWQGSWEVHDAAALLELLGGRGDDSPARRLTLRGALTGQWLLSHDAGARLDVGLRVPAESHLAFAGVFVKPDGAPLHLDAGAAIDPNAPALRDLAVDLGVGGGRLRVDRVDAAAGEPGQPVRLAGRVTVEKVEQLLACLPAARDLPVRLAGTLRGKLSAEHGPALRRLALDADLAEAEIALDEWLSKPAGRDAEITVELAPAGRGDGPEQTALTATWRGAEGRVNAHCVVSGPPADALSALAAGMGDEAGEITVEAAIRDVRRLTELVPAVSGRLGRAELTGPVELHARGRVGGGAIDGDVSLDATRLAYDLPGPVARRKSPGTELSVRLAGRLERKDRRLGLELRSGSLCFGGSESTFSGRAELALSPPAGPGAPRRPGRIVRDLALDARLSVAVDQALREILPEADALVREHGVGGSLSIRATLRGDSNSFRVTSHVDALKLAVADALPPAPPEAGPDHPLLRFAPVCKPADMVAEADLTITCPSDLSRVRLETLRARVGELSLTADAAADVALGGNGLPARLGPVAAGLKVSVGSAGALAALAPALKGYRLTGGGSIEARLTDAAAGQVSQAAVQLDKLRACLAGRELLLDGRFLLADLSPGRGRLVEHARWGPRQWGRLRWEELPSLGRLRTDGLEFRVGANHGWLLADLTHLPDEARGTVRLLAEHVDSRELSDWLAALGEPGAPAGPATRPATRPAYKLSESEADALRDGARRSIALARAYLARANLKIAASIARLKAYDISVDRTYDVRRLELRASIEDGHVKLAYRGGLNGGAVEDKFATYLTDATATVHCRSALEDVLAEENIQPQFAKFFPGNTVDGTLTRREETTASLVEVLAAAMDPRFPVRRTGKGKTVAVGGVTQGRAAPKFITKIFPGLNLAKYRYRKMTAFTEFHADGTAGNDMVFDGQSYDLYMEGTTDAQHIGRYEIGLILLGAPQTAEWNHIYRQGRIPLLNFQARIEGGKMHDEQVSYLWPNETLFVIFLKNNIFYRIWLAAGKNRDTQ